MFASVRTKKLNSSDLASSVDHRSSSTPRLIIEIMHSLRLVCVLLISASFIGQLAAICPSRCVCDEIKARAVCSNSQFHVIPIMLNPWLKELYIANNQISKMTPLNSVYNDLEVLDLSGNQIDSLDDNIFKGLSKIKVLNLSGNKITNITRNSLKGLDTIEHLVLSGNRIKEISLHAFSHLKNLKRLDLSENAVRQLDSEVFVGLTNLVDLNLGRNGLSLGNLSTEQNPIKSEYLPNLVSLNLSGNLIQNLTSANSPFSKVEQANGEELDQQPAYLQLKSAPTAFGADQNAQYTIYPKFLYQQPMIADRRPPFYMNRRASQQPVAERRSTYKKWGALRELDLSSTELELVESDAIGSLSQLQILKLRNNRIINVPSHMLKDLSNLRSLDISRNAIAHLDKGTFGGLLQLEALNISDCASLQTIHNQAFSGLTKLQRLDLTWCPRLAALDPAMFQPLANLKQLYLRGNALETLDAAILNYAVSLEILDVRNNPLNCDCSLKWLINVLYMYANQSSLNLPAYLPFAEQQQQLRLELSQVYCAGPAELKDKLILELTNEQLNCVDIRLFVFVFTGVCLAVVIVLLIILTAFLCVRYGNGKFLNLSKRMFTRDSVSQQTIGFKTGSLASTGRTISTAQRTLHKLLGTGNLYQTDKTFNVISNKPEFTWLPSTNCHSKTGGGRFMTGSCGNSSSHSSNYGNASSLIFNGSNTSTICPSMMSSSNYFAGQRASESTIISNLNQHGNPLHHHRLPISALQSANAAPMLDTYDSYLHHNYATLYETLNQPEHYASSMSTTTTLSSSIANQSQNSANNLVGPSNGGQNSTNLRNQSMRYQHPCVLQQQQQQPPSLHPTILQTWNPSHPFQDKMTPMINGSTPKSSI